MLRGHKTFASGGRGEILRANERRRAATLPGIRVPGTGGVVPKQEVPGKILPESVFLAASPASCFEITSSAGGEDYGYFA